MPATQLFVLLCICGAIFLDIYGVLRTADAAAQKPASRRSCGGSRCPRADLHMIFDPVTLDFACAAYVLHIRDIALRFGSRFLCRELMGRARNQLRSTRVGHRDLQ